MLNKVQNKENNNLSHSIINTLKEAWREIKAGASEGWGAGGAKDMLQAISEERVARKELDASREEYYMSFISVKNAEIEFFKTIGQPEEVEKIKAEIREIKREMNEPRIITNIKIVLEASKNAFNYIAKQ